MQGVHKFSQDYIVIRDTNHPRYPTLIEQQVYNIKGEKLFSTKAKYLYPTEAGLFIKHIFRDGPHGLYNFSKVDTSPDRSFFVISARVKEAVSRNGHNRNRNRALIAFGAHGNEL